ncbi:MAG TPA: hypothetical protein PJ988_15975 [Anaerolinea sp.]|nr:hypothetical protein [Anaerolinea sp.]
MRAAPSLRVPRSGQLYWAAVFGLLLLASLCSLAVYLFSVDWLNTAGTQPVALHSGLRADYSADLRGLKPLALSMGLIGEAARDRQPGATDPLPALEILLQTPVAWVTSTGASPTSVPPTQPAPAEAQRAESPPRRPAAYPDPYAYLYSQGPRQRYAAHPGATHPHTAAAHRYAPALGDAPAHLHPYAAANLHGHPHAASAHPAAAHGLPAPRDRAAHPQPLSVMRPRTRLERRA